MKIVIPGGSGQVGTILARSFQAEGHEVVVLSRSPEGASSAPRALRDAWGIPFGLPAAEWMLEIAARVLGTETELVLKSRRVVPGPAA